MEEKKQIVLELYEGLASGETEKVAVLLTPDLEWWFHGPPGREHMMRVLTGVEEEDKRGFRFRPRLVVELGKWVVAEGWENREDVYWVHAWAVEGGVITKFREYFNTRVTVRELSPTNPASGWVVGDGSSGGPTVWESRGQLGRSMPGLVLAI
ncbi:hypothetical protein KFK09_007263 [Dendrobium nobile]|uniref:Wound-induced protein 1 n=1 Tax=Dendrobium nobile TaxID=94219 RepID=A0A8T3BRE5_DENNO|nr:hypothetical protein KFK09_007263 [Dendrobium nobile]